VAHPPLRRLIPRHHEGLNQSSPVRLFRASRYLAGCWPELRGARRRGWLFVPVEGLQVIPQILLVVAFLGAAGGVVCHRPEAGGIRRQDFVDEDEFPVDEAELELGVRQMMPRGSAQRWPAVKGQADLPDAGRPAWSRMVAGSFLEGDVFVVGPQLRLGGGGEDGFGEAVRLL